MKYFLLLLFAVFFSCRTSSVDTKPNMANSGNAGTVTNLNSATGKLTYLALGDSYTFGQGADPSDRWPVQLAGLLRQKNVSITDPDVVARTGWTTAQLQTAMSGIDKQKKYDLVSLLIGVNNQYQGQPQSIYRTEFQTLLQTAIGFADGKTGRVVVLSIPDWSYSPFAQARDRAAISVEIDQFNAIAKDECQRANVVFINITPTTRQVAGSIDFTTDGLHYSGLHMRQWAEQALPIVKSLLMP